MGPKSKVLQPSHFCSPRSSPQADKPQATKHHMRHTLPYFVASIKQRSKHSCVLACPRFTIIQLNWGLKSIILQKNEKNDDAICFGCIRRLFWQGIGWGNPTIRALDIR
jgi:hypothetical protein